MLFVDLNWSLQLCLVSLLRQYSQFNYALWDEWICSYGKSDLRWANAAIFLPYIAAWICLFLQDLDELLQLQWLHCGRLNCQVRESIDLFVQKTWLVFMVRYCRPRLWWAVLCWLAEHPPLDVLLNELDLWLLWIQLSGFVCWWNWFQLITGWFWGWS